jgi:hypothetical protein
MKSILGLFSFVIFVLSAQAGPVTAAAPNPVDQTIINELIGVWTNQMGSTLTIVSVDANSGRVDGSYVTSDDPSESFPLIGWVNTAAPASSGNHAVSIAWTVRWGKFGSITSWTGVYGTVDHTVQIIGQWNLSRPNSGSEWDHILAGQDRFKQ